jgi:hypothetical protein
MTPHPILMHTLHDDRTRDVEAALRWQHVNQPDGVPADPASRQHRATRVLALLSLIWGRPKGKASSVPAR